MDKNVLLLDISTLLDGKIFPIEERFNTLDQNIEREFKLVNGRFELMDARFATLDDKIEALDAKIDDNYKILNARIDSLESRMDSFESRMDSFESRMDSFDAKFESLDAKIDAVEQNLRNEIRQTNILLKEDVIPRLNHIENCYLDTSKRYIQETDHVKEIRLDVSTMKSAICHHSEQLKIIS